MLAVPPRFLQGRHSLSVTFFWFILPKSRLTAHLHSITPLFSHLWNQLPQSLVLPYRASRQLFNTTSGHSPSILMIPFTPKWLHYPALPFSTFSTFIVLFHLSLTSFHFSVVSWFITSAPEGERRLRYHLSVYLSVSMISPKVMDGFGQNLMDRLGVGQEWID